MIEDIPGKNNVGIELYAKDILIYFILYVMNCHTIVPSVLCHC